MRRLLPVLSITAVAVLMAVALAPACGSKCDRKSDCATGEVCNAGVCEPVSADYVRCQSNMDCNPNGQFICRAGRCLLKGVVVQPMPDSGLRDTGMMNPMDATTNPMDATTNPMDATTNPMDAMPMDATATVADAGVPTQELIDGTLDERKTWDDINSIINAAYNPTTDTTFIEGIGRTAGPNENYRIMITFPGSATGTFNCTQQNTTIEWRNAAGSVFTSANNIGSCEITITAYGGTGGGAIQGTFTANMVATTLGTPPPANNMPALTNGSVDVLRDPDTP